ncbi:actin-related protein [Cyathus striatus]|nr:actin-related protein [Cyathus striatus]
MSIRDSNVIIIDTERTVVRAGIGLHDLLKQPTIEIQARVGLRRDASSEASGVAETTIVNNSRPSTSKATTSLPQTLNLKVSVNDYLVGAQLDEALAAGQDIIISWPFADGDVKDYIQAEAIWKHILFAQLQRRRVQNESPVLLTLPAGLARDSYERICQIFFERFNVAGFGILERPMAQLYAGNALSGIVVNIGYEITDITPIYDGFVVHYARQSTNIGVKDCQEYLAYLLRSNQSVMTAVNELAGSDEENIREALLALVDQVWRDNQVKVPSDGETAAVEDEGVTDIAAVVVAGKERAVIESGMKKKATAKASAAEQARAREIEAMDLITVQFREHSVTLGKERHRFCEPLFDPTLLDMIPWRISEDTMKRNLRKEELKPLQDSVGHAVALTEVDQRQYIWQGLLVTGDVTRYVKGIGVALQSRLQPYLASADLLTDVQPRTIRVLSVPEYYAEYRETGNGLAAYLGASIVAKIIFNESGGRNYVSKAEYTSRGPHAIIDMTPALF